MAVAFHYITLLRGEKEGRWGTVGPPVPGLVHLHGKIHRLSNLARKWYDFS